MLTLDELRLRYGRFSREDLLSLLVTDPAHLTLEAQQALAEEAERRGLSRSEAYDVDPAAGATPEVRHVMRYPRAPFGDRFGAASRRSRGR